MESSRRDTQPRGPRRAASAFLVASCADDDLLSVGCVLLDARPEYEAHRCAAKAKRLAQSVFQIALVGEMQQPRIVDEKDECGRRDVALRDVVELQHMAAERRWRPHA